MTIDVDAFGEVDLSGSDKAGRVGCMARRLAELHAQERTLLQQVAFVRQAQQVALKALDSFLTS